MYAWIYGKARALAQALSGSGTKAQLSMTGDKCRGSEKAGDIPLAACTRPALRTIILPPRMIARPARVRRGEPAEISSMKVRHMPDTPTSPEILNMVLTMRMSMDSRAWLPRMLAAKQ